MSSVLLDTNVLIAAAVPQHMHREWSSRAMAAVTAPVVAAHSIAEYFNILTKPRIYGFAPATVALQIADMMRFLDVRTIDAVRTVDVTRAFGQSGGMGARLYDRLIGEVAIVHRIGTIVTWNTRDMAPLFPRLCVVTPADYLETA